jgi:hypothetical protein
MPKNIEFLQCDTLGNLSFVAYSENVNRWDEYGLSVGDIVEKKANSDTVLVLSPQYKPRYLFELFDGIAIDGVPRKLP